MSKHLLLCCILIGFATASESLSILMMEPIPSTSHHLWAMHLVKGLLREGHHVHLVSIHEPNIQDSKLAQNLTYAVYENIMKELLESDDYDASDWEKYGVFYSTYFVYQWGIMACEKVIATKASQELLKMIKNVKFDVIVQDITLHQCLYGLWEIAKGKPPVVGYVPFGPAPWLKSFVGGSSYPTVRPYTYARMSKPEGLWHKTWNAIYFITNDLMRDYYFLPTAQRLAEQYVGHKIRPLREIEKENITIVLINTHSAFEPGIPLPPNTFEIGGLHAQANEDEIATVTYPENMREFLDGAENGAILISLGTNVNWRFIGLDKLKAVIQAVSKLKQRVLWKLDIKVPFEIPDNLMTVKWIPQSDLLSHKKVKAIWTHGGLLSLQEAIWKNVPMIVMPFFMDQKSNVEMLVSKGAGLQLDINTLSTENILHAFEQILHNESYARNMKKLSSEFRDRPMRPLDLAIWSIEYAVRHPHGSLHSPIRSQSWIEHNMFDVYAVLFLSFIIILLTIFLILKMIFNFYYSHIYSATKLGKSKQT